MTLSVEGIDRMYLNVYVPTSAADKGLSASSASIAGSRFASSALMAPISRRFVAKLERFVREHGIPVVQFAKDQRKDDVMAEHRAALRPATKGLCSSARRRRRRAVFRTEKRRDAERGKSYPWIVRSTAHGEPLLLLLPSTATSGRSS